MLRRVQVVMVLGMAVAALTMAATLADGPSAPPTPTTPSATAPPAQVWLNGPFGRLPGGPLGRPATADPPDVPLDTRARGAPLVIDLGARPVSEVVLALRARHPDGGASVLLDADADGRFIGPTDPGLTLLVATLGWSDGTTQDVAWLLAVPDLPVPEDGLFDIPAPQIILGSQAGEATGMPGSGCYVYLCVDTGRPLPWSRTPSLAVGVGETLTLRLGDGSGIQAWEATLRPRASSSPERRGATAAVTEAPVGMTALAGLEVPAPGQWLLTLKVTFDRERGWMSAAFRLLAE